MLRVQTATILYIAFDMEVRATTARKRRRASRFFPAAGHGMTCKGRKAACAGYNFGRTSFTKRSMVVRPLSRVSGL